MPGSQIRTLTKTESHQGICAKCSPYACKGLVELLPKTVNDDTCLLLLDQIVDPHNLGALIRTAYCAGLDGVVITKDRSAQPSPAVSKASAGALEHVGMARVTNMVTSIQTLKKHGLWVVGLDRHAGTDIFRSDLSGPLAIIVGGEEKGVRPLVKKHCDRLIAIPQLKQIDSLNASVAGGIVIYEALRQRKYPDKV
jgi:23S rRNA (guanosine2251-2'-O)-methyltransferase